MLASDLNNPDFEGARDPNAMLYVEFYWHEPIDWNKQQETGKIVRGKPIPYVRIQRPGDMTSIVETPVVEEHKARWPQKWLYWQMKEGLIEGQIDVPGWKIEDWNYLNEDQKRELKFLRFSVVEQIAGASDEQVQRMGMGGAALRVEARKALSERASKGINDAIAAKDAEIAEMKARMAKLESMILNVQPSDLQPQKSTDPHEEPPSERDNLVAQYVAKFGKKPHHKLKLEKLRAALG